MMTRDDLRGCAQTVLGLVEPATLGPTLMHEHVFIDLTPPPLRLNPPTEQESEIDLCNCWGIAYGQKLFMRNYRLDEPDVAIAEIQDMKAAGGASLVDLTVGGLNPQPNRLAEVARATGVNIVMGCGYYVNDYQSPANHTRSADDFAREMIEQITVGAWGTQVRAGIIGEIGCQAPWTDLEKRVMDGAITAMQATGAALNIHPGRDADQPLEVTEFIRARGQSLERVVISHIDRTIFDDDRLLRLADTGCVVEFDLFGWEQTAYPMSDIDMPNDGARLKMVKLLVDKGYRDQILISHDICTRTRLSRYGGHGYQHIFANIAPRMLRRGFTQEDVDTILISTPQRLLTFV
ncbi:MAG: aryldialkylphosphatase [Comamonadaceae bacterium]|nr:aryldialkylphosphatase [Comamonadaceae bacterium]